MGKRIRQDTPAYRVIQKCGGFAKTAELVGQSESWVYRWTYEKKYGGTGGTIPQSAQNALLQASARGVIGVQPADFFDQESAA